MLAAARAVYSGLDRPAIQAKEPEAPTALAQGLKVSGNSGVTAWWRQRAACVRRQQRTAKPTMPQKATCPV